MGSIGFSQPAGSIDLSSPPPIGGVAPDAGSFLGLTSTDHTINSGTKTVSDPALDLNQTWNDGAQVFHAAKIDVTRTASANTGNSFLDCQINGATAGGLRMNYGALDFQGSSLQFDTSVNSNALTRQAGNGFSFIAGSTYVATAIANALRFGSAAQLCFSNGTSYGGTADLGLARDGVGLLRVSNGSTGRGTLDAAGYQVGGTAGANFSGAVTNITVVNGIVTAAS